VLDMPISRYTGRAGELSIDQCQGSISASLLLLIFVAKKYPPKKRPIDSRKLKGQVLQL
jgi:hypothetical protein